MAPSVKAGAGGKPAKEPEEVQAVLELQRTAAEPVRMASVEREEVRALAASLAAGMVELSALEETTPARVMAVTQDNARALAVMVADQGE